MALGGIASAVEDAVATVNVGGDVDEILTFEPALLTIVLGTIDTETGATETDTADLFSTVDWQVDYTEVTLSNADHSLGTPLAVTVAPDDGVPEDYKDATALDITYFQAFKAGDYAGSYSGNAVLTASAVIPPA